LGEALVVICPFSLARLGASARLLGTLFWHGLAMATYRRLTPEQATAYFLYLDEFHQYVTPDLGDYLALARGYRVGLTLAHQDLGQLSPALKAAVMANCRQRIILGGISGDDERDLRRTLGGSYERALDMRHLGRGQALIERTEHGRLKSPIHLTLSHRSMAVETAP
jgi:hypothetical protein